MKWLSRDGKIIFLARGIRSLSFGFFGVLLGIYLKELGFQPLSIGLLLSAALVGGATFTLITGHYAVKHGIRKMLLLSLALSLVGISLFIFTENFAWLLLASLIGFISPSGQDVGPTLSLEHTYIPFTVSNAKRTTAFTYWNIIAAVSASIGALLASMPLLLQGTLGLGKISSFKVMFVLSFFLNLVALLLYTRLSEVKFSQESHTLSKKTKKIVTKLSLLFGLDSFAGGFIIASIISLWFYTKFNVSLTSISALFFAAGLLKTVSYLVSDKLAQKIGLIRTMVFTHIPANMLLILIPFMPTFTSAAALFLLRQLLSDMDIPARQSYIVAIVQPSEMPKVVSITTAVRMMAKTVGPSIASNILLLTVFSPFVLAGTLKTIYDISLYYNFRHVKPPEEDSKA